jgi:hypothetical protein
MMILFVSILLEKTIGNFIEITKNKLKFNKIKIKKSEIS